VDDFGAPPVIQKPSHGAGSSSLVVVEIHPNFGYPPATPTGKPSELGTYKVKIILPLSLVVKFTAGCKIQEKLEHKRRAV